MVLVLLVSSAGAARPAAAATVAPIPRFLPSVGVITFGGRPALLVKSLEVYGLPGFQLRVSCGCFRYNTAQRISHPARGATLYRGVNWILRAGSIVSIRAFREKVIGRYVLLTARVGRRPSLVAYASGCLASLDLLTPCPLASRPPYSAKGPVPTPPPPPPGPQVVQPPPAITHTLSIVLGGGGSGTVTGYGINCPSTCSGSYAAGTAVTITPAPAAGSTFSGWSGACSGTGACNVTLDADKTVNVAFVAIPTNHTYAETVGGDTNTWTNYLNAGGTQGPTIQAHVTVQISCRLMGLSVDVAPGDPWWYRIASAPWSDMYYASADAFYNNGQTTGTLLGTPLVDPNVPGC